MDERINNKRDERINGKGVGNGMHGGTEVTVFSVKMER